MTDIYECDKCGVVTAALDQLCEPRHVANKATICSTTSETGEMCEAMKEHFTYVCGSCGRPAKQAELLCLPLMAG